MTTKRPLYVIEWRFYDGSGSGVVEYVHTIREEAERICALLQEHGSKQYTVRELQLWDN